MSNALISKLLLKVTKGFIGLWFKYTKKDPGGTVRETIYELIEQDPKKSLDSDERILLSNVLDLKETSVSEIMIPRAQIIACDVKSSKATLTDTMGQHHMSRVIVYENTLDHALGYIGLGECFQSKGKFDVKSLIHPIEAIAPHMSILDLLLKMRVSGEKMFLVLDEHGGIDGLVTFSHLIQEIIGDIDEIDDTYLNPPGNINLRENGDIVADGHVELDTLEEEYSLKFHTHEDISTISGYILAFLGRLPSRGELISHQDGYEYLILDANPRKIKKVCIRNKLKRPKKKVN